MIRVVSFIDGFDLYHAIKNLKQDHLKWVDLRALSNVFVLSKTEQLSEILYFSAYANWLPEQSARHRAYVTALKSREIKVVMGQFKEKDRRCMKCGTQWKGHEEKETDVNIALWLLDYAYRDLFDRALIVSRDSDIAPAVRLVANQFPCKKLTVVAPPRLGHSIELTQAATSKAKITEQHIARCLLPREIQDKNGKVICTRPAEYDPPTG